MLSERPSAGASHGVPSPYGPLDVVEGDRFLPLGGHKQRAFLASPLIHANELVPTDRLIDALWSESPPDGVDTMLQVYVSKLRKSLTIDDSRPA